MKRIVTALTLSSLMLLLAVSFASASSDTLQTVLQVERDGDRPPTGVRAAASSSPKFDDEHFSADTGGELDQYLFRTQGDGYIRFNIPITRYYFAEADARGTWLTEEGFLIIDNVDTLLDKHLARDSDAEVTGVRCRRKRILVPRGRLYLCKRLFYHRERDQKQVERR